ncbi:MAG: hypothetical protein GY861_06835 [bacterium]|nr:hypothetical protein [bacterium]
MKNGVILAVFLVVLLFGCGKTVPETPESERDFLMGVVPSPKTIPETTFDDLTAAYEETGQIAEVTMVWTGTNIGQTEKLKQSRTLTGLGVYGLKPVLTLNFATIKEVQGVGLQYVIDAPEGATADLSNIEFRKLWVDEARSLAQEFEPEYLSLGNEINDYFYLNPDELDDYLSLYDEAYAEIKKVSPKTKVFVVFSYTHLIANNQWELLDTFNDRVDLIGLTTYPWKHFESPENITADYYTKLNSYTTKPIAFTEIGWVSNAESKSSESEQAAFLTRFIELTEGMDVEMIHWLFLHEPKLEGIVASVTKPETATISLKNRDGSKKEVYDVWLGLKNS